MMLDYCHHVFPCQLSSKSTLNKASPQSIDNWTITATARKQIACLGTPCLNFSVKQLKTLIRMFTVSCLDAALFFILMYFLSVQSGPGALTFRSPIYPASASTLSPSSKHPFSPVRKILISGQSPHAKGPFNEQISPFKIETPSSYLTPGFLNLWLNQQDPVFQIGQSVPSTVRRQSFPLSPLQRLLKIICRINQKKIKRNMILYF